MTMTKWNFVIQNDNEKHSQFFPHKNYHERFVTYTLFIHFKNIQGHKTCFRKFHGKIIAIYQL